VPCTEVPGTEGTPCALESGAGKTVKTDELFMSEALKEARKAFDAEEVPVGAVVVRDGKIIARAHNQIKLLKDPTAHAEMIAITSAASYLDNERLLDTTVYATVEPCAMCAGAMVLARIKRLVFGAEDPKAGAFGSALDINKKKLNHKISVSKGILENECGALIKEFFKKKRAEKD
jgi:tRNA(adenine34) deaminase